jgi:Rrf2 family iron-sulfur cluster assembly transcriptional regulator
MMLTTKSRYAVIAMMEVAIGDGTKPVKLGDIAVNQDISLSYLEQIFAKLKKANLVDAVKGPGGGYLLKHSPKEISIAAIVDAVDENLKMTRCSKDKKCRKNGINCKTHNLWKGLGLQITNYFAGISVADVMEDRIL